MYRSATTPSPHPDPFRVASRAQSVRDVVLALPASVNTAYWDRFQPELLVHDDISNADSSNDDDSEYCKVDSDNDSGYRGMLACQTRRR